MTISQAFFFRPTILPFFHSLLLLLGRPIIHRLDAQIHILPGGLQIPLEDLLDRLALGDDHCRWQVCQRLQERRRGLSRVLLEDGALKGRG